MKSAYSTAHADSTEKVLDMFLIENVGKVVSAFTVNFLAISKE